LKFYNRSARLFEDKTESVSVGPTMKQLKDVVLDTNVLIAAGFNSDSSSASIIRGVRQGRLRAVWSQAIRSEYKRTIERIRVLNWPSFEELLTPEACFESGNLHEEGLEAIVDPEDRKFAALARATGAVLVTADDHLLSVRNQIDIDIRKPSEIMRSDWSGRSWMSAREDHRHR
jgi:predicted nucleic acid-binding protein